MKLIMNADDFGLTEGVNQAIIQCLQAGIVQSTTLMVNQPGTLDAIARMKKGECGDADVGLHITLTSGKPVLEPEKVRSLVDNNGYFLKKPELFSRQLSEVDQEQAYQEMHAQYACALALGLEPSHIDTHHFAATIPSIKHAFIRFLNDIGLPARRVDVMTEGMRDLTVATPDIFDMAFFDEGVSLSRLKGYLLEYQAQFTHTCVEFMCHPGLADDPLLQSLSSYSNKRFEELQILTDPQFKLWLKQHKITPTNFSAL
ncbi:carbohydrate deacetylase [Photobacterium leiognathi]|uniref:carbohydrate deacetylase n=1 Tax=Photobacterium leiognathi TaxID=553611 RepID=UPI0029819897|nr:carbohydrate deacetylase [Photobacterium leiognathi]